jgi:hypothetical protein
MSIIIALEILFSVFAVLLSSLSHSMRGGQMVSKCETLKIHHHLTTVKLYTLMEQYETYQTWVTGL